MKTKLQPSQPQKKVIDDEIARASDEQGELRSPEEVRSERDGLPDAISWGEPPTDSGKSIPALAPEDEAPAGEQLVRGGVNAAETDRRKASEIGKQDQTRL